MTSVSQHVPDAGFDQTLQDQNYPSISVQPAGVMVVPSDQLVFSPTDKAGNARATLSIHNPTDHSIIYKFKSNVTGATLAVSPCVGHIHPGDKAEVTVNLSYDDAQPLCNLKMLVVTAPAPQFDQDLKSVWRDVASEIQTVTRVACVVNQPPAPTPQPNVMVKAEQQAVCPPQPCPPQPCPPQQSSSAAACSMQVTCPPMPSVDPADLSNCFPFMAMRQPSARPSTIVPSTSLSKPANETVQCPPPPPQTQPRTKSLAAVVETEELMTTDPTCFAPASNLCPQLYAPRQSDTSVTILKPAKVYYSQASQHDTTIPPPSGQTSNNSQAVQQTMMHQPQILAQQPSMVQPQLNYSVKTEACPPSARPQPVPNQMIQSDSPEGGRELAKPSAYYYESSSKSPPERRHHSYFVDVSPIAEREQQPMAVQTQDTICGVERNTLVQVCLLAAASVAASKILID
jgi:hypothetical protein